MQHVFWLREEKIAGRSGPNTDVWDLDEIKAGGIAARPIAFTAQGWKEFALEVLCHYQAEPGETRI